MKQRYNNKCDIIYPIDGHTLRGSLSFMKVIAVQGPRFGSVDINLIDGASKVTVWSNLLVLKDQKYEYVYEPKYISIYDPTMLDQIYHYIQKVIGEHE